MNNITIINCEVIPYSTEEPCGFVIKTNDNGTYSMFRVLESKYNSQPVCWFVHANEFLTEKIKKMKISPGDVLNLTGEVFTYKDLKRKKDSYKLVLTNLDYGIKKKISKEEKEESQENEEQLQTNISSTESIEDIIKRNENEIFVSGVNLQ